MELGMGLGVTTKQNEISEMLQVKLTTWCELKPVEVVDLVKDVVDSYCVTKDCFGDSTIVIRVDDKLLKLKLHDEGLSTEKWIGQYSAWYSWY